MKAYYYRDDLGNQIDIVEIPDDLAERIYESMLPMAPFIGEIGLFGTGLGIPLGVRLGIFWGFLVFLGAFLIWGFYYDYSHKPRGGWRPAPMGSFAGSRRCWCSSTPLDRRTTRRSLP